jgi:hypothetical protein
MLRDMKWLTAGETFKAKTGGYEEFSEQYAPRGSGAILLPSRTPPPR